MDVKLAAQKMIDLMHAESERLDVDRTQPIRSESGRSENHCHWMLQEIVDGNVTDEKAHRWLGYAQGYLVSTDEVSLEQCKLINKAS